MSGKRIAILGFAFKKNTGDTRESPAITVCKDLLEEGAQLEVYDPKVDREQVMADLLYAMNNNNQALRSVRVASDAYAAVTGAHAIIICTEWDEFVVIFPCTRKYFLLFSFVVIQNLDYQRIYGSMTKPAYIFDGRKILDHNCLQKIGFHVQTIGKRLQDVGLLRSWGNHPQ